MRNRLLQAEIEREVRRRVQAREMFTALDISRAVQASGFRERHNNMKEVVHGMYARGEMGPDYMRAAISLPGGQTPFLYHHRTDNSNAYAAGSVVVTRRANNFRTSPVRNRGNIRVLDRWNRLRLPARALRDAGMSPGDVVHVVVDAAGNVALHAALSPTAARRCTVDRYNNARIALGVLAATRGFSCRFAVEVASGGVVRARPV